MCVLPVVVSHRDVYEQKSKSNFGNWYVMYVPIFRIVIMISMIFIIWLKGTIYVCMYKYSDSLDLVNT